LICTDAFLWLTHQSLINLKMVSATFGIGGATAPLAPPPGYAPALKRHQKHHITSNSIGEVHSSTPPPKRPF